MPLQNRVTPLSELVETPARGLVYGNRGCLHDDAGRIRRLYGTKRWISCRLRFRNWHRAPLMQPGRFTELFLLDEATALAAGHRPCALCRRADYNRFAAFWQELHPGQVGADAMDEQLHAERLTSVGRPSKHERRIHDERYDALPDGTFVLIDEDPHLVLGERLLRWTPDGYNSPASRPRRRSARVLTPPSLVELLRTGWRGEVPLFHPTADL